MGGVGVESPFSPLVQILLEIEFEYLPDVDHFRRHHFELTWWEALELGFTAFYNLEMLAKLVVLGCSRYWRTWRNTFDGALSLSSLLVELAVLFTPLFDREQPLFVRLIM